MQITAIKTHKIKQDDILKDVLNQYFPNVVENSIIAITSKIISVIEERVIAKHTIDKLELIKREADFVLKTNRDNYGVNITIKNNLIIPTAGIDESNSENAYILHPEDSFKSAESIWQYLRDKHNVKNLGIIITDSKTTIMRRGVSGIGLAWCGFAPLYSYIGKPDIYGNALKATQINILDSLSASSVYVMGEGSEQTPFAMIKNAPHIMFQNQPPSKEAIAEIFVPMEDDLYYPLLELAIWAKPE